jgi:hypothetical protein
MIMISIVYLHTSILLCIIYDLHIIIHLAATEHICAGIIRRAVVHSHDPKSNKLPDRS